MNYDKFLAPINIILSLLQIFVLYSQASYVYPKLVKVYTDLEAPLPTVMDSFQTIVIVLGAVAVAAGFFQPSLWRNCLGDAASGFFF